MNSTRRNKRLQNFYDNLRVFRRSVIYQIKEFFHNSTLHGVRYITEKGRPNGERFMWFCFVAIGTVTALIIIMSLWEKFQTNPTITGLDTDFYNQNVVFPTTVICPAEAYDEENVQKVALSLANNNDEDEVKNIELLLKLLSNLNFKKLKEPIRLRNESNDKLTEQSLRQLVFQIAIKCENLFVECRYRDEIFDCCEQFHPIYTENGYCYAFNSRFMSTAESDEKTGTPAYLYETDKKWSLYITPNSTVMLYILPNQEYFGKEFIPKITWRMDEIIEVRISKRDTYTTDDARQLSISQRKCIFNDEVQLKYFPDGYTFTSCMKECRMMKSLQLCRCLPQFYKPIEDIPMCRLEDFDCLDKFAYNITSNLGCNHCELGCSETVYNLEKIIKSLERQDMPGILIEFLTWPIIRYRREVLFGWVDLLVSFGGIAGLFLGFSLLSGVEIIYYFTLRTCCMVYKNRQELYEMEERIKNEPPRPINMNLTAKFNYTKHGNNTNKQNGHQAIDAARNSALPEGVGDPPNYFEAISFRRKTQKDYAKHSQSQFKAAKVLPSFVNDVDDDGDWQYNYLP